MFKSARARRKFLRKAALAAWAWLYLVDSASAEPLTIAIFGSVFAASFGGAVVTTLFGAAGAYLINFVFGLFQPKSKDADKEANPTEVQYGDRVPRNGLIGICRLAGHRVHYNEYDKAKQLEIVHVIADAWLTEMVSVYVDNIQHDVIEVSVGSNHEHKRYTVDGFDDLIELRLHDGRPGQEPDDALIANTPDWDEHKTYSGMCYVVAEVTSNRDKFHGIPDFQFVMKGQRLYDPRKDDTVGGSGAHRFNDPTTWEYSANNGVGAFHFLRGFYFNDRRILGAGLSIPDLAFDTFVAAMNACDEVVTPPTGGTRPRYEMHMVWQDTDTHADVLKRMCDAMGGFFCEKQGQIAVFPGKAQSSVLTITDDDITLDSKITFSPKMSGGTLYTGIQGTYTHSADFQPTPYTALAPDEFVTEDGKEKTRSFDQLDVQDPHQAYLIAKLNLYQARIQGTAGITLDIKDLMLEVGDWFTWNSANPLRGNRTWLIMGTSLSLKKMQVTLNLREIAAAAFADDSIAADVTEPVRTRPIAGYQNTVDNFDITVTNLVSPSGATLPALSFSYDPITDPAVYGVEINYRTQAVGDPMDVDYQEPGPWARVVDPSPSDGSFYSTQGVYPGRVHEAMARIVGLPGREFPWTDPLVETLFATSDITAVTEVGDNTITLAKLNADLAAIVGFVSGNAPGSLASVVDQIRQEIAEQANIALTDQMTNKKVTSMLSVRLGQAVAAVLREETVRVTENEAFAEALTEVTAQFENSIALGLLQFSVIASDGGSNATIAMKVRAASGDVAAEAGLYLVAHADGLGGTASAEILLLGDNIFISDGLDTTQFVDVQGGKLRFKSGQFDHLETPNLKIVMDADGSVAFTT